jgi:nucleoside-diphosphate-sugar epimerase
VTKVLITGASGVAGRETARVLLAEGFSVRLADVAAMPAVPEGAEFVRCDTQTPTDALAAVEGVDAVIHLAAWHCAHNPPISDPTIFSVNVDGTFNIFEACRHHGVKAIVYASSMAYGHGSVYGLTKIIGEDMCRTYHHITRASVAMLRYHDFVPKPYLAFGVKLLRNGVDARDVATSNVASVKAALAGKFGLFRTIVHTAHGMPESVIADFKTHGLDWCESVLPGSAALIAKYGLDLPGNVEQHDLSEAAQVLDWRPAVGFREFLNDLKARDERGEDVRSLWSPGRLPD